MNSSHRPTHHSTKMHLQSNLVRPEPTISSDPDLEAVPQRVREIAMLRGLGYSFREIATPLNVTPQAVSLMLSRHRRLLKSLRGAMELGTLSSRAVNALGRHGIRTREEAKRCDAPGLIRNERNCGRKTLEEITHWLDGEQEAQ